MSNSERWVNVVGVVQDILGRTVEQFADVFLPRIITVPPPRPPGEPRYVELPELGISIVIDEYDRAECVQLWSSRLSSDYRAFTGDLGFGLTWDDGREKVRAALGNPVRSESGGPGRGLFREYLFPWDKFHQGGFFYHFEYTAEYDAVRLLSITLLD